jgi:putative DNA-invertase from lambdoid prophage Rac
MILGYVRVSTDEQTNGTSPAEQEAVIYGYAMTQGVDRFGVQIYYDAGVSAKTPFKDRPEGKKLIADVRPGDTVIAAKMDRIFRSARDALEVADQFMADKINLILFDMGIQPVTGDGPSRMFFTMLAAFAEFERGRIRDRLVQGKLSKAKNGGHIGGEAPYGFRVEGEGRAAQLVEDEREQEIVRAIKAKVRERTFTNAAMARELNEAGYRNRVGKPFYPFQVQRIAQRLTAN